MQFGVLGPLEVRRDGEVVPLPGGKQRALLARLLLDAGRVVSVDALTDALWGDSPPASAAGTIQAHVSHLRRALGADAVVTRAPGYVVPLEGNELDHVALDRAITAARVLRAAGRAEEALVEAQDAVALVRGDPYGEVAFETWAQSEVLRLRGLALAAHEEVHAAMLELGRHQEVLPRLQAMVEEHPFHERLRAQLMLALYRDGRQADALRCYQVGRAKLVDELGVDPGPELQQMEARILAQDPGLAAVPMPPTPPPPATPTRPDGASGLHGREATTAALLDAWRRATTGGLQVVVVEGRPGMGKTSVARALGEHARAEDALVGVGAAHGLAGVPPFWPWIGAVRELATGAGAELLPAAIAATPGGELLRPVLDGPPSEQPPPGPQFQLFDAATRVLAELARRRPALVVLDDLHWADQATLDLLRFLVRARPPAPLVVVATHRPVTADHALAETVASIIAEPTVTHLVLDPLGPEAVRRIAEAHASRPVDPDLAASIAERTGGNPFYVLELVRLLRSPEGALDATRSAVPEGVRATVLQRARAIGPHGLDVLELCSTAGGDFSDVIPGDVLGADVDVVGVLDAAVADGLVAEAPGRPGFYRFVHDIVRHALYDALPQRRRAEMHVAVARAIEARSAGSTRWAPALAAHYAQGIDIGSAREAVHWQREAAAQAVRSQAYADAVAHLRRSLFVTRTRLRDDRTECEVLIELAAAARLAADPATASTARERAHRLAERLGDRRLVTRATNVLLGPGPHWVRRPR